MGAGWGRLSKVGGKPGRLGRLGRPEVVMTMFEWGSCPMHFGDCGIGDAAPARWTYLVAVRRLATAEAARGAAAVA